MSIFTGIRNILGLYKEGKTVTTKRTVKENAKTKIVKEEKRSVVRKGLVTQTEIKGSIITTTNKETNTIFADKVIYPTQIRLTLLAKIALSAAAISIFNAPIAVAAGIMLLPAVPRIGIEEIESRKSDVQKLKEMQDKEAVLSR